MSGSWLDGQPSVWAINDWDPNGWSPHGENPWEPVGPGQWRDGGSGSVLHHRPEWGTGTGRLSLAAA